MPHFFSRISLAFSLLLMPGFALADSEKVVNIYNWADYISPKVIEQFEAEFGIKVNYDTYDSSEIVDAKLLAGGTGYDIILHDTQLVARLLPVGIFMPLDKSKLPNFKNYEPELLKEIELHDPGNVYTAPYFWGSVGFAYNVDMVRERVPDAPLDSADFIFKPEILEKLQDCGVSYLDSPTDIIPMALAYLGYDANVADQSALDEVEAMLKKVRPYIKYFDSTRMIQDLPSKEVCVAVSWSGDYAQAWDRAKDDGIDIELAYSVPKEGGPLWIDAMVIPSDAPHPDNAHTFINFIARPDIIGDISNLVNYANAVPSSKPFVREEILVNPAIYPPPELRATMFIKEALPPKQERMRTRLWARFKTGL